MKAQYITPAITIFDGQGNLDETTTKLLYDKLIESGVSGILIMGSIGEFFSLSTEQKKQLIDLAVSYINKRTRLIVGTGSMDVNETITLSNYAIARGADEVIIISPYYFAYDDATVEHYYSHVASEIKGNILLYNFPDRTGYDLSPQVALNLVRKHKNIVGYKDTVPGMDHTRELIKLIKPEFPSFEVFSGYDDNFAHNLLSGGDGCIAGLSNLVPELCGAWIKAFADEDFVRIYELQRTIDKLMSIYRVGIPFVPFVKKAMQLRGLPLDPTSSFPQRAVTEEQAKQLTEIMRGVKVL